MKDRALMRTIEWDGDKLLVWYRSQYGWYIGDKDGERDRRWSVTETEELLILEIIDEIECS